MSDKKYTVTFWIIVLADGTPKSWTYTTKGEAERALKQRLDNPLGPPEAWYGARILPAYVKVEDMEEKKDVNPGKKECPVCGSFLGFTEMQQKYDNLLDMATELYSIAMHGTPKPDHVCGSPDARCDCLCDEYAKETARLTQIGLFLQNENSEVNDE